MSSPFEKLKKQMTDEKLSEIGGYIDSTGVHIKNKRSKDK